MFYFIILAKFLIEHLSNMTLSNYSTLVVRLKLRPFGPAVASLAAGNVTDADNDAIKRSLDSTRPYVLTIWAGLLVSTALGLHLI